MFTLTPAARGAPAALTNKDVLVLVEAGLPAPVIVAKIKASRTDFNTSEGQLAKLAQAGANANVLETMIRAGSMARHREHLDWQAVQCDNVASVRGYLDAYPGGQYEPEAKACGRGRLPWVCIPQTASVCTICTAMYGDGWRTAGMMFTQGRHGTWVPV